MSQQKTQNHEKTFNDLSNKDGKTAYEIEHTNITYSQFTEWI